MFTALTYGGFLKTTLGRGGGRVTKCLKAGHVIYKMERSSGNAFGNTFGCAPRAAGQTTLAGLCNRTGVVRG